MFARAIVIVLDSVGIGELPDASAYGDEGSNTLGNIAKRVPLHIPTLRALGLDKITTIASRTTVVLQHDLLKSGCSTTRRSRTC